MTATELFTNDATCVVLSGGGTAVAGGTVESWVVDDASHLPVAVAGVSQWRAANPAAPSEKILVTAVTGNVLTVTRGAESTTPVDHLAGGTLTAFVIRAALTAGALAAFAQGAPMVLDGTAGDIQPTGTAAAAGATGKAADAGHVHAQGYFGGVFGDGSDGALVFDGVATVAGLAPASNVYTLTRDLFATSLTVNNGVTLKVASQRIFCRGTLTNNGTISGNGNNATSATGAGSSGNGSLRGTQPGGNGTATTGAAGSSANTSYGVGSAGAGGTGTGANTGGAAGTTNSQSSKTYMLQANPGAVVLSNANGGTTQLSGASGGGGGGGDGTNSGGGGGAGGGFVMILAWAVVNNGAIQAAGGNGFTPTLGNCGGGGPGGGGVILVYSLAAMTGAGTTSPAAGTPGSGVGTGTAGAAGTAGTVLNVLVK